ncbi:hypothetical protein D4764_15G0003920, partial [Takifugu flavidus]
MVEIPSQGRVSTLQHLHTSFIKQTCEVGGEKGIGPSESQHTEAEDKASRAVAKTAVGRPERCAAALHLGAVFTPPTRTPPHPPPYPPHSPLSLPHVAVEHQTLHHHRHHRPAPVHRLLLSARSCAPSAAPLVSPLTHCPSRCFHGGAARTPFPLIPTPHCACCGKEVLTTFASTKRLLLSRLLLLKSQKDQSYWCSCTAEEEKKKFSVCCEDKNEAGNRGIICRKSRILPRRGELTPTV